MLKWLEHRVVKTKKCLVLTRTKKEFSYYHRKNLFLLPKNVLNRYDKGQNTVWGNLERVVSVIRGKGVNVVPKQIPCFPIETNLTDANYGTKTIQKQIQDQVKSNFQFQKQEETSCF